MDILKCTHSVSLTALLTTALILPAAAAQSANALLRDTSRQDVGTVSRRRRPGFCSSFRSRECLRVSMPSTFMPWASASHPHSTRRVRTSIRATRITVLWWVPGHTGDMPNLHIPPSGSLEVELVDTAITIDNAKPIPSSIPTAPQW